MHEYLAGPTSAAIDRNLCISVMASTRGEAAKKARILHAETNNGILVIRADGEDTEHEVSPVDQQAVELAKQYDREENIS